MYLPPLFPTLLRTTGAGFSYNIGRVAAAAGTIFFGLFSQVGDFRHVLLYGGFLYLPAAAVALLLPELNDRETVPVAPVAPWSNESPTSAEAGGAGPGRQPPGTKWSAADAGPEIVEDRLEFPAAPAPSASGRRPRRYK